MMKANVQNQTVWRLLRGLAAAAIAALMASCSSTGPRQILVSVADQKLALLENGKPVKVYAVSTSKYGLGDRPGSYATPLGKMVVAQKIGSGVRSGTVFHSRRPTREVVRPNSPGRDPIVSRIMWLQGRESKNARAYSRCIYIHGTAEEWSIGTPASYGCIRMRSKDVIDLFNRVGVGTPVSVTTSRLSGSARNAEQAEIQQQQMLAAAAPPPPQPQARPAAAPMLPPLQNRKAPVTARAKATKLGPEVRTASNRKSNSRR
jgi:lipoprotein-anchoring transpeptidase ErfK/SrfK